MRKKGAKGAPKASDFKRAKQAARAKQNFVQKEKHPKRKFKVYPSAYANMYASGVCSGKIKPGGKKKS